MSRLIVTAGAAAGLEKCRSFLKEKNPFAMVRAAQAIERSLALLESEPEMGRPIADLPTMRELIIPFGESGYVGLYRYERSEDTVYLLAFRHRREAGF